MVIKEVAARLMAVLHYSGRWAQADYEKKKPQLKKTAQEMGVETGRQGNICPI